MADASNKLPWKKNLLYELFFCSVAIVSAGRLREVAGFSLEIFYKDRMHGATDFFTLILARLAYLQLLPFCPISTFLEMKRDCIV